MAVPAIFDVLSANATLGVALAIGWLAVLGINLYQYRQCTRSPERFYLTESVGGFWLAFSLLQIETTLTGIIQRGVVVLAVGLFCAGVATGVRWWRLRNAGPTTSGRA